MLIVALGLVLATVLEGQIERRALEGAEQLAQVTAQVGVAPQLMARAGAARRRGVESASVLEALVELRCNSAQGYFLSRPLPAAELEAWLRTRSLASAVTR